MRVSSITLVKRLHLRSENEAARHHRFCFRAQRTFAPTRAAIAVIRSIL